MATKLKGITVEIGGDVKGLNKAIQGTNKEIRNTQTELQKVERLLKLDPSNTELLKQKQELLSKAVGETADKLDALKAAKKKADDEMKSGTEINQEQYRALQREIASTENSLKGLEKQASSSNATMAKISGVTSTISQKSGKVASTMAPVTAGIAGIGFAAVKAMDNVDSGLDVVMQKTGATGEAAKDLKDVYDAVAKEVPSDFADIGAAVGEINTRLDFTGEQLRAASVQFLKFAKVNGADVNTAVQLVTRAMGDAGISADRYGEILDALTVAGQKSGISIDTLAGNLAKYGAPMRALGIDTKNAIAMFAGWEKAGVNTEIAFSGMKKAISTWGASGKDSTVEFQKTLAAIKSAPSIASATSMAIDVFGAKAGPDLADAIRGGRFEVDQYIQALNNAGGAVSSTYGQIVDEVDDTQLAMQTAQVSLHDLGETIAKTLGPIILTLAGKLQDLCDWFNSLDGGTQNTILTIIALVAAISPIAGIISGITGALTVLLAHPVVLLIAAIVAAIAALVVGFIYLWKNCEGFRKFWIDLWDNVSGFFVDCWNGIVTFFTETIPNAWNSVVEFFKGIPEWWNNLWKSVGEFFMNIWNRIVQFFQSLPEKAGYAIGRVIGFFMALPGRIWTFLTQAIEKVKQWGVDTYNSAKEWVTKTISDIGTWFSELPGKIWTWLNETINKVKQWGADMIAKAKEAVSSMVSKVVETVKSLPGKMLEIGKDIVRGIWNGITGMFSWLKEKVGGFFGGIVNGIKDSLGIHSPSKVFAGIGKFMASGIGVGFDDQMSKVAGSIQAAVPAPMQSSVLTGGNVQAPAPSSMFGGGVDVHIANFNNYDTGKDIKTLTDTIMVQMEKSMSRKRVAVG